MNCNDILQANGITVVETRTDTYTVFYLGKPCGNISPAGEDFKARSSLTGAVKRLSHWDNAAWWLARQAGMN